MSDRPHTDRSRLSDAEKDRLRRVSACELSALGRDAAHEVNYLDLPPEVEDERKRVLQIIEAHWEDLEQLRLAPRLWNMISSGLDLDHLSDDDLPILGIGGFADEGDGGPHFTMRCAED
jgi:hypothetical protein